MSEVELERLAQIGNRKSVFLTVGAVILMAVSSYATIEIMKGLGEEARAGDIQKRIEAAATIQNRTDLKIRSLVSQIEARDTRLKVLEGEFVFGGSAKGAYTEKQLRLRNEYLAKKEAVLRARTLPILTAQIDALRPRYKNSQWEKKKIPDLPESRIMAQWFYNAGQEADINPMILIAVAWTESRFRPDICHGLKISKAGAIGCMQIMPLHVERFDFIQDVKQLTNDIEINIMAGGYILREYLDSRYAEEAPNRLMVALRLYNYGPKNYGSRMRKKAKFNSYAENVIAKAEMLFDLADPFREKFDPENDPAKFLLAPLALNELPAKEDEDELY